ncbi:hypothetical protein TNCV_4556881 [Trichonephila clavipes]|nr:hypothetical protein TNCV_4556881 [Trichonephila clavipes]
MGILPPIFVNIALKQTQASLFAERTSSNNHLDDFLRWRTISRLEAGQSEVDVATSGPKLTSRLCNQLRTGGTLTRRMGQVRHRATTSAQDRFLISRARRSRRTTAPQLAAVCLQEFPEKWSTSILQRLAFQQGVQSEASSRKDRLFVELKTSVMDTSGIMARSFRRCVEMYQTQ